MLGTLPPYSHIFLVMKLLPFKLSHSSPRCFQTNLCGLWKRMASIQFVLHTIYKDRCILLWLMLPNLLTRFLILFGIGFGISALYQRLRTFYGEPAQMLWLPKLTCFTDISLSLQLALSVIRHRKLSSILFSLAHSLLLFGLVILLASNSSWHPSLLLIDGFSRLLVNLILNSFPTTRTVTPLSVSSYGKFGSTDVYVFFNISLLPLLQSFFGPFNLIPNSLLKARLCKDIPN